MQVVQDQFLAKLFVFLCAHFFVFCFIIFIFPLRLVSLYNFSLLALYSFLRVFTISISLVCFLCYNGSAYLRQKLC